MCEELFSSIFRNTNRKDTYKTISTVNEILKTQIRQWVLGGDVFLKKLEMICIKSLGDLFFFFHFILLRKKFLKMPDNTYGSIF